MDLTPSEESGIPPENPPHTPPALLPRPARGWEQDFSLKSGALEGRAQAAQSSGGTRSHPPDGTISPCNALGAAPSTAVPRPVPPHPPKFVMLLVSGTFFFLPQR